MRKDAKNKKAYLRFISRPFPYFAGINSFASNNSSVAFSDSGLQTVLDADSHATVLAAYLVSRRGVDLVDRDARKDLRRTSRLRKREERDQPESFYPKILLRLDVRVLLQSLGNDPRANYRPVPSYVR